MENIENETFTEPMVTKSNKGRNIAIMVLILVVIFGVLYYFRAAFVAATVNGSPISRLAIIHELEKRNGKEALDNLITRKLIDTAIEKENITLTEAELDDEVAALEAKIAAQGGTLQMVLDQQGISQDELRKELGVQKKLEKLLASKTAVTDAEVDAYIKDNKITVPKGVKVEDFRSQIKSQLEQQKFTTEGQKWVSNLKASAKIRYLVNYEK